MIYNSKYKTIVISFFVLAQPLGLVEMVIVSENLGYLNYATRTICNDCY